MRLAVGHMAAAASGGARAHACVCVVVGGRLVSHDISNCNMLRVWGALTPLFKFNLRQRLTQESFKP